MTVKLNKCIDCGIKTKGQGIRCYSCSKKGKNNPMNGTHTFYGKRPSNENISIFNRGEKSGRYIDGRCSKKYYCKCGNEINHVTALQGKGNCYSCAQKDRFKEPRNHPRFGKIASHGKGKKYKGIFMRSSYEISYAKYLDKQGIKWQYEPKTFDLGNTTYTPDFYLPESDTYVEIKGWWRDDAKKKFKKFQKKYYSMNIILLTEKELKRLKIIK